MRCRRCGADAAAAQHPWCIACQSTTCTCADPIPDPIMPGGCVTCARPVLDAITHPQGAPT